MGIIQVVRNRLFTAGKCRPAHNLIFFWPKLTSVKKQVLFIQGGGNNGYETDAKLVSSLLKELGTDYEITYPRLETYETEADFGWPRQIGKEIDKLGNDLVLVAHSLGASLLLKYLSENQSSKTIAGIFLLSTPFWNGDEHWMQGLKLTADFAEKLPGHSPIFFYYADDDKEISKDQFEIYRQKLPGAIFRMMESGGHQLGNDLELVAKDIKSL